MSIVNKTKKTPIASRHKLCTSVWCKALGLMFHAPISDYGLVFDFFTHQRPALHNMFVFYPIDILFVDKDMKVVDLKESFMPFTPHLKPRHPCRYVIELPGLTIENSKTAIGDRISLEKV